MIEPNRYHHRLSVLQSKKNGTARIAFCKLNDPKKRRLPNPPETHTLHQGAVQLINSLATYE